MGAHEHIAALSSLRVMLLSEPSSISHKVAGAQGEVSLSPALMEPVIEALHRHEVQTLGELAPKVAKQGVPLGHLSQVVSLLIGCGHVVPVAEDSAIAASSVRSRQFNQHVLNQARWRSDLGFMASPMTGGGVSVSRVEQLFLLCRETGETEPQSWSRFAWSVLESQGIHLSHQGILKTKAAENMSLLTDQANNMKLLRLPVLQKLGVVN